MNVKEMLGSSLFADCQLDVATERGLLREVAWTCPSGELSLDRWIMPGLVLICVHRTFEQQRAVIEAAGESVSAVVHFGCVTEQDTADGVSEALAFYEQRDIPLIRCSRKMSLLNFARHFSAMLNEALDEEQDQTQLTEDLCTKPFRSGVIHEKNLGIDLKYSYACVMVCPKGSLGRRVDTVCEELALGHIKDFLTERLSREGSGVPWFADEHRMMLFVPSEKTESAGEFKARIRKAIADVKGELKSGRWRIVIGERVHSLRGFRDSYEHALKTEVLVNDIKVNDRIVTYDDWYTHIQLLSAPREDLERQMRHVLGPILDDPDLIDSLTSYLYYGENTKLAAEKIYIHVNTLRYRLGRISDVLDVNLKDPTARFRLRIAVTIYCYLYG